MCSTDKQCISYFNGYYLFYFFYYLIFYLSSLYNITLKEYISKSIIAFEYKIYPSTQLCHLNFLRYIRFSHFIHDNGTDGGWQKSQYSPFLATKKCHGATILHKLAKAVVKKAYTAITHGAS